MRTVFLAIVFLFHTGLAGAENPAPYPGTRIVDTGKPFAVFLDDLLGAIKTHKMGVVAQACADCGAKSIGVTIAKNRVVMIFRPDFAVRMLKASVAAGIEAPLRLYVTEQADGNAQLTYRQPSAVFGVYKVPELDEMATDLDGIVDRIVTEATAR
ncbi:MAG: DUF302 domain-containing protein [Alphaproteobacteria bacterium]|nr:DUF302 domain-containing protein [Alphaproteobacteria bacterium]